MAATLNSQVESRIQSFVAELTALVRTAALESVEAVLGGSSVSSARRGPRRRGPGRPKGSVASKAAKSGRRIRRSSEDVDATASRFMAFVKANDGKRLEEISRALKIPTANLKLPAQKLLAAKAVKTTGAKRGTKYHVGGGGRKAAKSAGKAKSKRAAKKVVTRAKAKKAAKRGQAKRAKSPSTQPTRMRMLAEALSQPGGMVP